MKISIIQSRRGMCLKLHISLEEDGRNEVSTECFNISNLAEIHFKFGETMSTNSCYMSWRKHESVAKTSTIKVNVICEHAQLHYSNQFVGHQSWIQEKFGEFKKQPQQFGSPSFGFGQSAPNVVYKKLGLLEITVSVSKVEKISFANLFDDDEFCDFNLKTVDGSGSVPVHKACLIVYSDMFRRMLSTEWKETIDGCIKIQGVTLQNLRHLKEYFYLGTLPDSVTQLLPLLLIAKCYMIENLKTECIVKLVFTVKPEELHSLQEFAVDNRLPELVQGMIQMTVDKTVQGAHQIEQEKKAGSPQAKKNVSECQDK